MESFHNKSFFYSDCIKFWVVQNYFPIVTKLNKINVKKKTKSISTFEVSALYTTIPHKLLIKVLSGVINLVFKSKIRKRITSIGLQRNQEEDTSLNKLLSMLCLFSIINAFSNLVFKQDIGIPMGIGQAPFWVHLFFLII